MMKLLDVLVLIALGQLAVNTFMLRKMIEKDASLIAINVISFVGSLWGLYRFAGLVMK